MVVNKHQNVQMWQTLSLESIIQAWWKILTC
jgi:hypothetical protein